VFCARNKIEIEIKKLSVMKFVFLALSFIFSGLTTLTSSAQTSKSAEMNQKMFIDVHEMGPGKVKLADVAAAHARDLAVEKEYGVHFINYWVDEAHGKIYCLSTASDTNAIRQAHGAAHGLLQAYTYQVSDGAAGTPVGDKQLFIDIHQMGAGNVTAAAVAEAHKKDLAVQQKFGVNFINYWVDEKAGVVMCLSEAKNADAIINTHKEAHGLIPAEVRKVKQGE
jgi:hypothetical protein